MDYVSVLQKRKESSLFLVQKIRESVLKEASSRISFFKIKDEDFVLLEKEEMDSIINTALGLLIMSLEKSTYEQQLKILEEEINNG